MVRNLDEARELWSVKGHTGRIDVRQTGLPSVFERSLVSGTTALRRNTPDFFYGICFAHSFNLLHFYIDRSLRRTFVVQPLTNRAVATRAQLRTLASPTITATKEAHILHKAREAFLRRPLNEIIVETRSSLSFPAIRRDFDDRINHLRVIRNCVVHNRNIVTKSLEQLTYRFYKEGQRIRIDANYVSRSITVFSLLAISVDQNLPN